MKFTDIINELGNATADNNNSEGRRDILKSWGAKLAAATVPFAAVTLASKKSQAKTTETLDETIYLAMSITRMQVAFYTQALNTSNLIPSPTVDGSFVEILKEKKEHEAFWTYYLNTTSTPLPPVVSYDFTAKYHITKVFSDFATFLQVAQALEDVSVRVYLTAINEFYINQFFRKSAMNIAATNARHAAHVRLRRRNIGVDTMPWISGTKSNSIFGEVIKGYQEEDNTYQWKNNIVGINGFDISFDSATEAFDEPMQRILITEFLSAFIA